MVDPLLEKGLDGAIWGFSIEVGFHVLRLIIAGVFDRFPRLQIMIGHVGESLPFTLYRIDYMHGQSVKSGRYEAMKPLKQKAVRLLPPEHLLHQLRRRLGPADPLHAGGARRRPRPLRHGLPLPVTWPRKSRNSTPCRWTPPPRPPSSRPTRSGCSGSNPRPARSVGRGRGPARSDGRVRGFAESADPLTLPSFSASLRRTGPSLSPARAGARGQRRENLCSWLVMNSSRAGTPAWVWAIAALDGGGRCPRPG